MKEKSSRGLGKQSPQRYLPKVRMSSRGTEINSRDVRDQQTRGKTVFRRLGLPRKEKFTTRTRVIKGERKHSGLRRAGRTRRERRGQGFGMWISFLEGKPSRRGRNSRAVPNEGDRADRQYCGNKGVLTNEGK